MTEVHTFIRLDGRPVDDAINAIKRYIGDNKIYGFVGCKDEHGNDIYQWEPEDDWESKVRKMLEVK